MTEKPLSVSLQAAEGARVAPADWEWRAAAVRAGLVADEVPTDDLAEVLGTLRLQDESGRTWVYNGSAWLSWHGTRWSAGVPSGGLAVQPFTLEFEPDLEAEPPPAVLTPSEPAAAPQTTDAAQTPGPTAAAPAPEPPRPAPAAAPAPNVAALAYRPTHRVPAGGLPAWSRPDAALAAQHSLDPGLDVMVVESYANGWARIVCSNTWSGWVDGRLLVAGAAGVALGPGPLGMPAALSPARAQVTRPGLDWRAEIGLAALLGVAAWVLAVFVAPVGLRFAMLGNPIGVGLLIAVAVVVGKALVARRALGGRDAVMFLVDAAAAAVVFYLFSPA